MEQTLCKWGFIQALCVLLLVVFSEHSRAEPVGFVGVFAPENFTANTQTFGCGSSTVTAPGAPDFNPVTITTTPGCAAIQAGYRYSVDALSRGYRLVVDYSYTGGFGRVGSIRDDGVVLQSVTTNGSGTLEQVFDGGGRPTFWLTQSNGGGANFQVSLVSFASGPLAPNNVSAVLDGSVAAITWDAPTDLGDAGEVSVYRVIAQPGDIEVCLVAGSILNCTAGTGQGLEAETPYTFVVRADSINGASLPSDPSGAVSVPASEPAAPSNVVGVPGNGEVTVSWTAPGDTGGVPITGYTVTGSPGGSCSVAGSVTECSITGLTNGTAYTFTVVASNSVGDGPASAASAEVIPAGAPSAPLSIEVSPRVNGLLVAWTAPLDNGGSPIVNYVARANPSCEVAPLTSEEPGITRYSCEITGLSPSTEYTVFVAAITEAGLETEVAAAAGDGPGGGPGTFSPLDAIAVPVNHPFFLIFMALLAFGLAVYRLRERAVAAR